MSDLLIGTSGYDYPEWKGVFYPQDLKRKDFLSYYALIRQDLKTRKISRSKDALIKYFGGCLDIHYKNSDACILYSSGQIGSGMNTTIAKAAHVRKIVPYKGTVIFFQDNLETMNVTFIRNGQLSIMPFPFKYLKEVAKMSQER